MLLIPVVLFVERAYDQTCVIASGGVGIERFKTNTCVIASGGVFVERVIDQGLCSASGGVGMERGEPTPVLYLPVVLE